MDSFTKFKDYVDALNLGEASLDVSLAKMTTLKVGGCAACVYFPSSIESLVKSVNYLIKNRIDYFTIGNGSNLLISNRYHEKVFINLKRINRFCIKKNVVYIESGANASTASKAISQLGFSGLEFLAGIPGSFGGIIAMNAGSWNKEIADNVRKIVYIDEFGVLNSIDTGIKKLFSYRSSFFIKATKIIVSCEINLQSPPKGIKPIRLYEQYFERKKEIQPIDKHSAGSVFKNPVNEKAWKLIENSCCTSLSVGDAKISDKHKNFIINESRASFSDVEDLINMVQNEVYEKYHILLEPEIIVLK